MSKHPPTSWKHIGLPLMGCLLLGGAIFVSTNYWQPNDSKPASKDPSQTYPGLDLEDPAANYQALLHAADTGGNEGTRSQAIVWLDTQARTHQPLTSRQESHLLDMFQSAGHQDWDMGYRQHLFNSAFSALHYSPDPAPLTKILAHMAENDADRTLRLYALQHIAVQRQSGRLTGERAGEMHALLQRLLAADPDTAGTVVALLAEWDGTEGMTDPDVITRAIEIAADSTRPVDVRVTALHAAGPAALDTSRTLSADTSQPILLRKAAIACIGRFGTESDMESLKIFSSESSRLAQAADPARLAIHNRHNNPSPKSLTPF